MPCATANGGSPPVGAKAWRKGIFRKLCTTSTKLQLLLMAPNRVPQEQRELSERIYWNALLFESDLLAELDLPHSGVVAFEENVGLPGGFEGEEHEAVGRDDLWYFLAEIALRRLLNRVSQLIYSKDSMASTTSLEPVVAELDFEVAVFGGTQPVNVRTAVSCWTRSAEISGTSTLPFGIGLSALSACSRMKALRTGMSLVPSSLASLREVSFWPGWSWPDIRARTSSR